MKAYIKLNSSGIKKVLLGNEQISRSLKREGETVAKNLNGTVKENNSIAHNKSEKQSISTEAGKSNDRQNFRIYINDVQKSDFIFGSFQKALLRSGAKLSNGGE